MVFIIKKRYNRKCGGKMKKIFLSLLILICAFLLTGCNNKKTDAIKFKEEYESINNKETENKEHKYRELNISKDNPFVYATEDEIVEKINNKESFIVYFGFKECPWCRSVLEELIHAAKDKKVDKIYYVDVLDIRDVKELENGEIKTTKEGTEGYMKLIELLGDVLDDYTLTNENEESIKVGEKRIYAPNVVAISSGKAIKLETGTPDYFEDPYSKLTKKIRKYSYDKFTCLMKCLEEESTVCKKNSC